MTDDRGETMGEFKIRIARIEMISPNERSEDIRLTFQLEGGHTSFVLPIFLNSHEFDDTEIVRVARSKLHDVLQQLCRQSENWQLSEDERRELARINVRPATLTNSPSPNSEGPANASMPTALRASPRENPDR